MHSKLKYLFFTCFLLTNSLYAKISHLTCSQSGLHIAFINGVAVDDTEFENFSFNSKQLISSIDDLRLLDSSTALERIRVDAFWNQSFMAAYDGFEAWKIYMERQTDDNGEFFSEETIAKLFMYKVTNNFKKVSEYCPRLIFKKACEELDKILLFKQTFVDLANMKTEVDKMIKEGRKILFISHSAGALFVDNIRDYIRKTYGEEVYLTTSHLALARPLETNHNNSYYLTFTDDEITEFLRALPLVGSKVPPANLSKSVTCFDPENPFDKAINHDYDICYLGNRLSENKKDSPILNQPEIMPAKDHVKNAIYRVASYLINNDKNCCNKSRNGKVWINPDTTFGGFVSSKINLIGEPYISRDSQLCGKGVIDSSVGTNQILNQSIIDGEIDLTFPFDFWKLTTSQNSRLTTINSTLKPNSRIQLSGVTIDGNVTLKIIPNIFDESGYMYIQKTKITGNSEISGGVIQVFDSILNSTKITGPSARMYIEKLVNKPKFNTNINISSTSSDSSITQLTVEKNLKLVAPSLQIINVTSSGSLDVEAGVGISLANSDLNDVKGQCDSGVAISGSTIDKPLNFSECISNSLNIISNEAVTLKGSSKIWATLNGINSTVGKLENQGLYLEGEITGSTFINSPGGMSFSGLPRLDGNLSLVSNCSESVGTTFQMAIWDGDFSHTFNNTNYHCFEDSNGNQLCYDNGLPCQ